MPGQIIGYMTTFPILKYHSMLVRGTITREAYSKLDKKSLSEKTTPIYAADIIDKCQQEAK